MDVRDYQVKAKKNVRTAWNKTRSVLLCAPTGSGKTCMGESLLEGFNNPLWTCHRRDLKTQTQKRLNGSCQVESIPKLANSIQPRPEVDLLVIDEAHHTASDSWQKMLALFPNAKIVGLTATPQRSDGKPLDMFEELVVAATYSELLALGHLVPCHAFEPKVNIDSGMALSPVEAYLRYARGKRGFCFVPNIKYGDALCMQFIAAGVRANVINNKTPKGEREYLISCLSRNTPHDSLDLLINCTTLTEGIDVPSAEICILARRCIHSGLYLQIVGRILRPWLGKAHGTLLDLVGAVRRHGFPTQDREYSLYGTAIRAKSEISVRQCFVCGAVMESFHKSCITCGQVFVPGVHRPPKIHDIELQEVYAGSETPNDAMVKELQRLVAKGARFSGAAKQFEKLFGRRPTQQEWCQVPHSEIQKEYKALLRHFTFGQAGVIMKGYLGFYPNKWRNNG